MVRLLAVLFLPGALQETLPAEENKGDGLFCTTFLYTTLRISPSGDSANLNHDLEDPAHWWAEGIGKTSGAPLAFSLQKDKMQGTVS